LPAVPYLLTLGYFEAVTISRWTQNDMRQHKVHTVCYWCSSKPYDAT